MIAISNRTLRKITASWSVAGIVNNSEEKSEQQEVCPAKELRQTEQTWENNHLSNRLCHGEMIIGLEREETCKVTLIKKQRPALSRWQDG